MTTGRRSRTRPARRLFFAVLLVASVGNPAVAAAMPEAERSASYRPASPDSTHRDATPGRPVTVVFGLANASRAAAVRRIAVIAPHGWRVLSGTGDVRLAAAARRAHFAQVSVPSTAAAGTYPIVLRSEASDGRGAVVVDTAYVRVREVRSLTLEPVTVPSVARAGTPFTVEFLLRNRGNRPERVHAMVDERKGFAAQPSWREATLAPGKAHTLSVAVSPSGDLPAQTRHWVGVVATAHDPPPGGRLTARAMADVLVLRSGGGASAVRRELPAALRLISSNAPARLGERASSTTIELTGGGALRERGTARVDFLLRGPAAGTTGFGERDEYRVALRSSRLDLIVGDQMFASSPLTGHARDRTGVNARARLGGFHVGGMAYRDRRGFLDDAGYGGSLGYARHGIGSLTINAARGTGYDSGQVASVRAEVSAIPLARLDAELAASPGTDTAGVAYRVQLSGAVPGRLSYAVSHRQADAHFAGHAPGSLSRSGRADLRLLGALGVRATAGEDRVTARRRLATYHGAQHVRRVAADAYVGRSFSAGVRTESRGVAGATDTLAITEQLLRFTGEVRSGPAVLRAALDVGTLRASGESTRQPTRRESLAASYGGRRRSASVFAEHRAGPRWYDRAPREELTVGLSALLRPFDWLSVRGAVSTTRDQRVESRRQLNGDATLAVAPRPGHELSLRARTFASGILPMSEPSVQLAYRLPIGVPIGGGRDGGRLLGRVYDAESGHGLANAVVVVGGRVALTDRDGRVEIDGVPEGTQYIQLDLGASGADRVPSVPMPLRITSRKESVARIEVPVARSVGIAGTVQRLAPASTRTWDGSVAALTDSIPMEGIVVRLVREGEVHSVRTDATGGFAVGDLRPGRWTIRIAPADLPAHHYLEMPELTFDVAPGQQARAAMQVLPRKRTVVMVDRAEIVADGAATTPSSKAPAVRAKEAPSPAVERLPDWKVLQPGPDRRASVDASERVRSTQPAGRSLLFLGQSFYIVGETDRSLENIALLTYGEADMWPRLWLANRHQLTDPDVVRPGTMLVIPPRGPLTAAERAARDALQLKSEPAP